MAGSWGGPQDGGNAAGGGPRVAGDGDWFGPGPQVAAVLVSVDLGGGLGVPVDHGQVWPAPGSVHQNGAEPRAERGRQPFQRGRGAASGRGGHEGSRGMRATPANRSQGGGSSPIRGRHWLTGTTPGATSGSPPNKPVTWAWVRGVTGTGARVLYAAVAAVT